MGNQPVSLTLRCIVVTADYKAQSEPLEVGGVSHLQMWTLRPGEVWLLASVLQLVT